MATYNGNGSIRSFDLQHWVVRWVDSNGESFAILAKIVIRTAGVHALIVQMRHHYSTTRTLVTLNLLPYITWLQPEHNSVTELCRNIYIFTITNRGVHYMLFDITMLGSSSANKERM